VKTWQELLRRPEDESVKDYGPNSTMVLNAFTVLSDAKWLSTVGQPLEAADSAVPVKSWEEALAPWAAEPGRYLASGHLIAPAELCRQARQDPQIHEWWELAREDAFEYFGAPAFIPEDLPTRQEDLVDLYLYEFVSWLMAEIVGVPEEQCSHFRTMLAWFQDGRFPCGWAGEWPQGRWLVY
jgi:hypothetical protein